MLAYFSLILILCIVKCLGNVIVIGAGISGLAAANRLKESNIDVIVLESQNRTGGRMKTVNFEEFGGKHLDFGAQWIHGSMGNKIYDLAKSLDFIDSLKNEVGPVDRVYENGTLIDSLKLRAAQILISNCFYLDELGVTFDNDRRVGEVYDECFYSNYSNGSEPFLNYATYQGRLKGEKIDMGASDLKTVSASASIMYRKLDGEYKINIKNGYNTITNHLASKFGLDKIHFQKYVESIDYTDTRVVVTVKDLKTNERKNYTADQAIVTVSTAILQQRHQELFRPKLPDRKLSSFDKIQLGIVNKMFFIYEKNFTDEYQGMQIFWNHNNMNDTIRSSYCQGEVKPFYKLFQRLEVVANIRNILFTFIVGDNAQYIANLSDNCVLDVYNKFVKKLFPMNPLAIAIKRTNWQDDEYFRGSYSFWKYGTKQIDIDNFLSPVDRKIYFAGEATSETYYGTVHGAFESGIREAENIINSVSKMHSAKLSMFTALLVAIFIL